MLTEGNIYLDLDLKDKAGVFDFLSEIIAQQQLATPDYVDSMKIRDQKSSVAIGNYLVIPHSEYEGLKAIKKEAIVFVKLAHPITWDGNEIYFVIALIVKENNQMDLLSQIAIAFSKEKLVKKFYKKIKTKKDVLEFISID